MDAILLSLLTFCLGFALGRIRENPKGNLSPFGNYMPLESNRDFDPLARPWFIKKKRKK